MLSYKGWKVTWIDEGALYTLSPEGWVANHPIFGARVGVSGRSLSQLCERVDAVEARRSSIERTKQRAFATVAPNRAAVTMTVQGSRDGINFSTVTV